jgi:hypothetical protein
MLERHLQSCVEYGVQIHVRVPGTFITNSASIKQSRMSYIIIILMNVLCYSGCAESWQVGYPSPCSFATQVSHASGQPAQLSENIFCTELPPTRVWRAGWPSSLLAHGNCSELWVALSPGGWFGKSGDTGDSHSISWFAFIAVAGWNISVVSGGPFLRDDLVWCVDTVYVGLAKA